MATIKEFSAYLQEQHSLQKEWEVYKWECVPRDAYTHMQLTGYLTTTFQRGPRKGQTKYTKELEKTFILSNEEVDAISANQNIAHGAKENSQICLELS